ncbi:hypothetical protein L211DRAFT_850931 [Terfezia boudieri ATCC MYA-4762]|uniref:Uncharacterized protein n=1 Tax=Terfezia boudieri ATCC MYA-4762 TaxID=1051890 RepID=A0A3N4LGZ4_9PEZI|nr:hypothetical protein L211DRAFT_850931 [Terfezia boudieri ATCC MYA-4762]
MSSNDNPATISDETTVRKAAERVGFFGEGIPSQLYTQWRKQVHRGIQNFNCYGPEEAGSNKWESFLKKARGSRQAMWIAIHMAWAAHRVAYHGEPAVVEPPKWPLPDVKELRQPSAGPSYMPRTAKGKGSAGVKKATMELNAERDRVHSCKHD